MRERAVLITKDEDFSQRRLHAAIGPTIVWLRVGNVTTKALRTWFLPLLPQLERMVASGEAVIELR